MINYILSQQEREELYKLLDYEGGSNMLFMTNF